MTLTAILVCTVGGSDAPIVTAVRSARWDHVVFVCSDTSITKVTGDAEISAQNDPSKPGAPPIPQQAGLDAASWSTRIVPPDDPDAIYAKMIGLLDELRMDHPHAEVIVDFTGGTKSMSAGAALAVASRAGVRLQVTSGQRTDLVRVRDGTQQAIRLGTDRILIEKHIELLRATWGNYGYQEAAEGFDRLAQDAHDNLRVTEEMRNRLIFWARLGRAFAAWDRFDRKQAVSNFHPLRKNAPPEIIGLADLADALNRAKTRGASSLVLFDLLRNVQRCQARGRFDDAVARCYRLWEMTAQWLLQVESGISTGDLDPQAAPTGFLEGMTPKANGRYKIGSAKAWALYRDLHRDREATHFWAEVGQGGKTNAKYYDDLAIIRNESILAHGTAQIDESKGKKVLDWTAGPFMDMVRAAASRLGHAIDMPQLPVHLPEPTSDARRRF